MICSRVLLKLLIFVIYVHAGAKGENVTSTSPLPTSSNFNISILPPLTESLNITSVQQPNATLSYITISVSQPSNTTTSVLQLSTLPSISIQPSSLKVLWRSSGRIVNGQKANVGQFPYVVSIRKYNAHFCGGSLITDQWVLTAAHCLYGYTHLTSKLSIVAGETQIKTLQSSRQQNRGVKKQILNPLFADPFLDHDIALILVDKPFEITPYVQTIEIGKHIPHENFTCTTAGWGYLAEDIKVLSDYLMYVHLPIIEQKKCEELLGGIIHITSRQVCAGYMEGGKDACQGDSGGPLICGNKLVGVVSGGRGCARPKLPGFYTNVPMYTDWIHVIMNSNDHNMTYHKITKSPNASSSNLFNWPATIFIILFIHFINFFMDH